MKAKVLRLFVLAAPLAWGQEGQDTFNLFGGGGPTTAAPAAPAPPTAAKASSAAPSASASAFGSSKSSYDRVGDEPALRMGIKYLQHQKMEDSTHVEVTPAGSPPPTLEDPLSPTSPTAEVQKGDISLSQVLFDGYISFLSLGRQFGAIEFGLPLRQLRSDYAARPSGSEFGGMSLALVAGERGVGSFGIGADHLQSPTLRLVEKHQRLKGFFYLERGGFSGPVKGARFLAQLGPELSVPLRKSTQKQKIIYDPMYGGKILLGYATSALLDSPVRLKAWGNYFRVNRVIEAEKSLDGGGLMAIGGSLDFNVAGDLWLGIEGIWAATKPKGREFIFGNPEVPGLYGNSMGAYIQAAAF